MALRLLGAADVQVWNTTQFTVLEKRGFHLRGFGVVRARNHLTGAYDNRLGVDASYRLASRLSVIGGYLSRWVDPDEEGSHRENRLFAGPSVLLARAPFLIQATTRYERFVGVYGESDFNQYKGSIDVERRRRKASPFLVQQFNFRNQGLQRSRSIFGIRWRSESGRGLEIGYQFDSHKSGPAWVPWHSIRTGIELGPIFGSRH